MKIKYLKLKNWLLASLGGLLGINLAGCDRIPIACEYGCPEGIYHVKGTVTNDKGEPVEGIGVVRIYEGQTEDGQTVYSHQDTTDANGHYNVNIHCFPGEEVGIHFDDIDGEQNGLYQDTVVAVKSDNFHGGDGNWNHGTAEITQNVAMQPAN